MALSFTSTNVVTVIGNSSFNNAWDNGGTVMVWIYQTSTANPTAWVFPGGTSCQFNPNTTSVLFGIGRATQNLNMVTAFSNLPTFGTNKWSFLAAVWNVTGVNGDQHLYHGDLTTLAAEASAYAIQRVGSGSVNSSAGLNTLIGNVAGGSQPMAGSIALVAIWNRQLSLAEIRQQQFRPMPTSGCVLLLQLGFNGTGTQPDLSGSTNAVSVTGASVADHVPLGSPSWTDEGAKYVIDESFVNWPMRILGEAPGGQRLEILR